MDFRISKLLRWLTALEFNVLLVAGGGLFFFPDYFSQYWAWDSSPFNAGFMGAVYLASMLSTLAIVMRPCWSVTHSVMPMIAVFTVIVLAVSIMCLDDFTGSSYATLLWFALYIIIPVNALCHMWMYRSRASHRMSHQLSVWVHVHMLILGGYGILLLLFPDFASGFWLWTLDAFHARLYSVAFITPAVGTYMMSRSHWREGLITLGITQVAGGVLPIISVIVVDERVQRVMWSHPYTWIWIGLFGYIGVSGIAMLIVSRVQTKRLLGQMMIAGGNP